MKQIIVITDGCSNVGVQPVVAAASALAEGIVVNVIGIVDGDEEIGVRGEQEIEEISRAGGGMSRIVRPMQLSQTVQMMTRKTLSHTIHQVVNKELKQILGGQAGSLEELPPEKRSQVVQVMDELTETAKLQVAILVDASASMKPKLQSVREAIADLALSLQARQGLSEVSVFHFPGMQTGEDAVCDVPWTNNVAELHRLFVKLNMRGTTPTGPALLTVLRYFDAGAYPDGGRTAGTQEEYRQKGTRSNGDGMLSDYVV